MIGLGLTIVESVVVSVGRVSVVVVNEFVDVDADEVDCVVTSRALCDTGSTIANGFLWRFSGCCPVDADDCAYGCVDDMVGGSEGWDVGTFDWSI